MDEGVVGRGWVGWMGWVGGGGGGDAVMTEAGRQKRRFNCQFPKPTSLPSKPPTRTHDQTASKLNQPDGLK